MIGCFNIAAHTSRAEAGQVVDRQGVSIVVRGGSTVWGSPPPTPTRLLLSLYSSINLALLIDLLYAFGILISRRHIQNSNVQL